MSQDNLTAEQWYAIAEKLAEYLETYATFMLDDDEVIAPLDSKENWIEQAKKELGYE